MFKVQRLNATIDEIKEEFAIATEPVMVLAPTANHLVRNTMESILKTCESCNKDGRFDVSMTLHHARGHDGHMEYLIDTHFKYIPAIVEERAPVATSEPKKKPRK